MMGHQELMQLLPAYVDQELDLASMLAVERHLESCSECHRECEMQRAVRTRLRQSPARFAAPGRLSARVAAIGHEQAAGGFRWNLNWPGAGAVAAMLLLVAAVGVKLLGDFSLRADSLAEEVISSHVRAMQVDHLVDVASSDQHTVKPWFNGKLDFAPPVVDLAQQGFPLAGGRLDYLDGRPVAALVYMRRKHPINVFISPAKSGDAVFPTQERQGFRLLKWVSGGLNFRAVSDIPAEELGSFAAALRAAVQRQGPTR